MTTPTHAHSRTTGAAPERGQHRARALRHGASVSGLRSTLWAAPLLPRPAVITTGWTFSSRRSPSLSSSPCGASLHGAAHDAPTPAHRRAPERRRHTARNGPAWQRGAYPRNRGTDPMKAASVIAAIIAALSLAVALPAAWLTHVILCLQTGQWGFLIAGALIPPVAIVHGVGHWFGAW
jgi:hypothetical protein